ncbi:MAG: hypothetical protein Q9162_007949, partial [Coniocarpon cinnabarinum]
GSLSSEMLSRTTSRDTGSVDSPSFAARCHADSLLSMNVRPSTATHDSTSSLPTAQRVQSAQSAESQTSQYSRPHKLAIKRIRTLDAFKTAHEYRPFWLNTLNYERDDSAQTWAQIAYFEPQRLARRAVNYFLLGHSIPGVLDPNADNPVEYLRTFLLLLTEFETFTNLHPPEGGSSGAMSRVRMPKMFSRPSTTSVSKARRGSGIDGLSISTNMDDAQLGAAIAPISTVSEISPSGESYQYLLTPSLPFDPDYHETYATLCDVLMDCYSTMFDMIGAPDAASAVADDLFMKVDGKVKKLCMMGLLKDLEMNTKASLRAEMAGLGKVGFGGLMC